MVFFGSNVDSFASRSLSVPIWISDGFRLSCRLP